MEFHPATTPVPAEERTDRLLLRPLRATDVDRDYDAVMSDPAALRRWSQTEWPEDHFTLAENLQDLERHEREHLEGIAFTYTVLDPAAIRCLGCVYITPVKPAAATLIEGARHPAAVGFWVRSSEHAHDLDRHLLATLRAWFAGAWAFDRIVFTVSQRDARQTEVLEESGLPRALVATLADGRTCGFHPFDPHPTS